MAVTKKRKHVSIEEAPACQSPSQRTIKAFASVRKFSEVHNDQKKRKTLHQRDSTPPPRAATSVENDKKRKRRTETDHESTNAQGAAGVIDRAAIGERTTEENGATSPLRKRVKNIQPASPVATPSKSAMAMLDKLKIDTNVKAIPFALNVSQTPAKITPKLPGQEHDTAGVWPSELEDLRRLHSAFLTALSLYYAHNGTTSPVNVKALLPMITKTWKKRSVSLDDLRILLGMEKGTESAFALQDFGRAGICLTKRQPRGRATKRAASYIDEADLNSRFEFNLNTRWVSWLASTPKENRHVTVFLDQLPLSPLVKSESVEKAAPFFARGHQRLADIKASQAASNAESLHPSKLASAPKVTPSAQSRGTSLLDRILAKQTLTASLPAGPTKQQLERKAALHRVEDITRVLDLLAGNRSRCSFSMPAMVQQLQQSLRNPISREEVERCLDLMAREITPGFVSLVKSGSVTGVVVTKGGRVGLEELRERVERALD